MLLLLLKERLDKTNVHLEGQAGDKEGRMMLGARGSQQTTLLYACAPPITCCA